MEANQEKKPPQQKLQINKEMYLKITTQKMCLTSEIRTCFLGIPYVEKTYHNGDILNPELHVHQPPGTTNAEEEEDQEESASKRYARKYGANKKSGEKEAITHIYQSVFKVIDDPAFMDISEKKRYLFDNIDVIDDTSYGQRAFNRNIDRLGNQHISYYRKNYPAQAD